MQILKYSYRELLDFSIPNLIKLLSSLDTLYLWPTLPYSIWKKIPQYQSDIISIIAQKES